MPLHLRLLLDPRAPGIYHALRWESLQDPRDQRPLALKPRFSLSRFVNARDWRPVQLRQRRDLNALLIVADPDLDSLNGYEPHGRKLTGIEISSEITRARASLGNIPTKIVAGRGSANLPAIIKWLKGEGHANDGFDIVYLVCHGALLAQGPVLYLETEAGDVAPVQGGDFVDAVTELTHRPTLITLAACESAGADPSAQDSTYASAVAIGPMLATMGIPAVLAMHGNVTTATVEHFMPRFFEQLQATGSLHEALSAGRYAIRNQPDWWAPVLFTRLRSGQIWFRYGVQPGRPHKWPVFVQGIKQGFCTPVLGPGLSEGFFPSKSRVAQGLAARCQVPVSPQSQHDLTRVCQYLAVNQDARFPRGALISYLSEFIHEQILPLPGESGHQTSDDRPSIEIGKHIEARSMSEQVNQLISEIGRNARAHNSRDAYGMLADLPFQVYFTTSWTNLLEDALRDVGRRPQVAAFQWNKSRIEARAPLRVGDPQQPVVFRLFGNFDDIDSIVLTEDDYFQYLTKWALVGSRRMLSGVLNKLTNSNLLLLGFGLDDWDFRVLFRSIQCMEGAVRLNSLAHIAVQLNPESETLEPEVAQQYLEDYLGESNFSVHWGTPAEFLEELTQRWQQSA